MWPLLVCLQPATPMRAFERLSLPAEFEFEKRWSVTQVIDRSQKDLVSHELLIIIKKQADQATF